MFARDGPMKVQANIADENEHYQETFNNECFSEKRVVAAATLATPFCHHQEQLPQKESKNNTTTYFKKLFAHTLNQNKCTFNSYNYRRWRKAKDKLLRMKNRSCEVLNEYLYNKPK